VLTSGPIGQIINLLAKKSAKTVGKSGGKLVARDIRAAEAPWTHADKIKELATDSGISKSYLKDLVASSSKKEQLQSIQDYLNNSAKAGNLTDHERYNLFVSIVNKIKDIENYEVFKEIIKHGTDIINHL
jgi:hypothetical protein